MPRRVILRTLLAGMAASASCFAQTASTAAVATPTQPVPFLINMDSVRNAVVFLHRRDADGKLLEAGTGFLLLAPLKAQADRGAVILVTARHVVDPEWAKCPRQNNTHLFIRFNTKQVAPTDAASVEYLVDGGWTFPSDDSGDLAATLIDQRIVDFTKLENSPIKLSEVASPNELAGMNTGAEIVSAGLLLGVSGEHRNYPIFKFGNISSRPSEQLSVQCTVGGEVRLMTEWLIAASLVPGNSGSPILYSPPGSSGVSFGGRASLIGVQSMSLMGSDIAGMTPISYLGNVLQQMDPTHLLNLDQFQVNGPIPSSTGSQIPFAAPPPK